jgi:aminoglycoside N3'-acetyltransferase
MSNNNEKKLKDIFNNLNFKEEFIIIHSDFLSFYKFNIDLKNFYKILKSTIGYKKTLVFPCFNFKKTKKWYSNYSSSETGVLSEYVRKNDKVIRTIHPIHSVVVCGQQKTKVPIDKCLSSFGSDSCWEWFCKKDNVRNLSLGIGFVGGATFCHHAEEKANVWYRNYKNINTLVYDSKDKLVNKRFIYYDRKKNVHNNWKKCEKELLKKRIYIKHKNKFNIPIFSMNTKKAINCILQNLKKNKNFLID